MPNLPISGLPAAGPLDGTEPFPLEQGGATKQATTAAAALLGLIPFHPGYVSGRRYSNAPRTATPVLTVSQALNTIHYTPLQLIRPTTIQDFGIQTGSTNAAAGLANIGLYANGVGLPGALLQTLATAVAIPGTANTRVTVTPGGGSFALAAGWYWFAVQVDTTINFSGDTTSAANIGTGGTTNTAAWFVATASFNGATEAAAYAGGLPVAATPTPVSQNLTTGLFRPL